MRAIASAAVSAMKSSSLDLLTWRIPGMTAYEAFIPGCSTRNRNGHISGARLESGTMTTESSSSFWMEFETTIPGRTFPRSGGLDG